MIRAHVIRHGHRTVRPTVRMLRYWWARLNAELFDGKLLPPQLSYGSEPTPGYGSAEADGVTFPLGGERVRIHIADTQTTRQAILATLGHEMIHQWQYQHGQTMNHGEDFHTWAALIKAETELTC